VPGRRMARTFADVLKVAVPASSMAVGSFETFGAPTAARQSFRAAERVSLTPHRRLVRRFCGPQTIVKVGAAMLERPHRLARDNRYCGQLVTEPIDQRGKLCRRIP